jgi:CDP-diacylglycerol--glycerol-3-phosphate 3-phosphatidyltransferase
MLRSGRRYAETLRLVTAMENWLLDPPPAPRRRLPVPGRVGPGEGPGGWDRLTTAANGVTLARTVVAVPLGLWALVLTSAPLLVLAYCVYWIGDIADGWLARRRGEETRTGAVLDIVSDRACSSVLVCGLMMLQPQLWPALTVFLVQFMVVDCVLSLSFVRWPWLLSPNYFFRVDSAIYRLNWSPAAKAANTAGVVLVVSAGHLPTALTVAVAQLAIKIWSAARLLSLAPGTEPIAPAS